MRYEKKKKRKLILLLGAKPDTDPTATKCWVKDFILPHKYYAPNFY